MYPHTHTHTHRIISIFMQGVVTTLLYYATLVAVYMSFIHNKQWDLLSCFFLLTLFVLSGLATKNWIENIKNIPFKKILKNKKILGLFMLSLISLFIGFFNVSTQYSRGIENPEMGQFDMSNSKDIISASIRQQQTPLDYYFSAFSRNILGENKLAVRGHAMFFYLILSLILPLMLYFFCSSFWITIVGFLLFSTNHVIRLHSVDARPLCLALLTGFLFLFFYLSFITYKNNNNKKIMINKNEFFNTKSFFPLLASQYLFAISIGLQPVTFIISLFFSSFTLLAFKQKKIFLMLFISHAITLLLTLPYYIKMFLFGKTAYKFKEFSFSRVTDYFTKLEIMYFIEKYFYSFYKEMTILFLAIIIGLTIPLIQKKRFQKSLLIIIPSIIFFPLIYNSIFQIGIIWIGLNNWYIIVFSCFLIFFPCLSLKEIESSLKANWNKYFYVGFSLLFIATLAGQIQAIKHRTQFGFPYRDNSIERVYKYLRLKGSPRDIAIEWTLKPVVFYRDADIKLRETLFKNPKNPLINSFYVEYTKQAPFFYEGKGDIIYYIEKWPIQALFKNINIFFIVDRLEHHYTEDTAYEILSQSMIEETFIGKYAIFKLTLTSQNKEKEYLNFLYEINKRTPKKYKGALLETLLYYTYKSKNKSEFDRLLSRYRDIEIALDEFIPHFNYPSRFELRRRVKYFENLKWQK